ncbi:aminopeptidase P N-terminal domain-containing protein [Candidatus Uhrbacteria bacterium]|nr:aminopeptidase P N-terminal domain-containing protein [Candidatus Uhrbacteria bacterium]
MDQSIFKKRRKEFLRRITEAGGGVVVLEAGTQTQRNHDVEHEFRQDSNFYYLTRLEQPGAIAVFDPSSKKPYTLFVHPREAKKELWSGPSVGVDEAIKYYQSDHAVDIGNWKLEIGNLLSRASRLWYRLDSSSKTGHLLQEVLEQLRDNTRSGKNAPDSIYNPLPLIAEMRLIKSKEEIVAIQKAIDVTAQGFRQCLEVLKPGLRQYQLRAEFEHALSWRGVARHAYPAIITSGAGTCVLHNPHDRGVIQKNSLVLVDAGAEWDYYAADITRTVPASGTFNKQQRTVYEIVLEAQERAIAMIKPGVTWQTLEDSAREFMTKQLVKYKVLLPESRPSRKAGSRGDRLNSLSLSQIYFPHKLGHWLGLDVHDVGLYTQPNVNFQFPIFNFQKNGPQKTKAKKYSIPNTPYPILNRPFAPGMVLTIEPGIYLRPSRDIAKEYWNIGIRIEDDILVTRTGSKNLSQAIPKDPDVLERMIQKAQSK